MDNKLFKELYAEHWDSIKDHVDENGCFPDKILGEEIWPLWMCCKFRKDGKLWWQHTELYKLSAANPNI